MVKAVTTYEEFSAGRSVGARMREALRDAAVSALGLVPRFAGRGWVRFPFYHHVYDDERSGFARHIEFLRNHGDFLTLDDAVALLRSGDRIDGRFFCLSFDDGLGGCANAIDMLAAAAIPATIFVVSDLMGQALVPGGGAARNRFGYRGNRAWLNFLTWDQCRQAQDGGICIGSHTGSHVALAHLTEQAALAELQRSKETIEREMGRPCHHFCAPFGMPRRHYLPERDPGLAQRAGYVSFATGIRGPNRAGQDVLALRRDQLLAGWSTAQLRYFLARP